MKLAAASALAGLIPEEELSEDYIIPQAFDISRAPALPHDGVINRSASCPVPYDGRLPLIRDANGRNIAGANTAVGGYMVDLEAYGR